MAHKNQDEKLRKIKFQTPKIIKIVIWGVIAIIISISIGIWIWTVAKKESKETKTSVVAASALPDYPLCADGEYDFSNLDIKKVGKVEFPVRDYCWAKVTLPSKDCVTHDPVVEVRRVWDDGTADIDGPNRVVKSRAGSIIFVKSLQGEGVYKILARR